MFPFRAFCFFKHVLGFILILGFLYSRAMEIETTAEYQAALTEQFVNAAAKFDIDEMSRLIEAGVDINRPSTHGMTALKSTVLSVNMLKFPEKAFKAMEFLLYQNEIDVNYIGRYSDSALSYSIGVCLPTKHLEFMQRLLRHPNIDVNASNDGWTPLAVAVRNKALQHVKLLLERPEVELDTRIRTWEWHVDSVLEIPTSPEIERLLYGFKRGKELLDKVRYGDFEEIRKIIKKGAWITNARDPQTHDTVLHVAAKRSQEIYQKGIDEKKPRLLKQIIMYLLLNGADSMALNKEGKTFIQVSPDAALILQFFIDTDSKQNVYPEEKNENSWGCIII